MLMIVLKGRELFVMERRIITIAREFGSGGRIIAQKVAEKMGYNFYDKELIARVAEESGFSLDCIKDSDENTNQGGFLSMSLLGTSTFARGMNSHDAISNSGKIYIAQCNVIKSIAETEKAVIVGRSASQVLRGRRDALHVFIHGQIEDKIKRAIECYGINEKDAEKTIFEKDKSRAAYFKNYSGMQWGMAAHYDITLNSSSFGLDFCADLIVSIAEGERNE